MAAASSSLPVPLSPRISTAEWVAATLRAIAIILRTAGARALDRLERAEAVILAGLAGARAPVPPGAWPMISSRSRSARSLS